MSKGRRRLCPSLAHRQHAQSRAGEYIDSNPRLFERIPKVQSDKSAESVLNAASSRHRLGARPVETVRALDGQPLAANSRACVLTSVHPPFDVRIFHKECKSLAAAGYDVTLIATATENGFHEGIALNTLPDWKNRFHRFLRGSLTVYKRALEVDADVYHFHDPELIPTALLLRLH